ncbi:MAG: hypothetical protein CMC78_03210 [Flavobacteriaceae bacterium]|nr:hypothetical protein [Flavobacteriaceae bacterium]|tara:strand:+ start:1240 stop:3015 length:1776 start_codon:yes stop_codon:yes gene_type:complete
MLVYQKFKMMYSSMDFKYLIIVFLFSLILSAQKNQTEDDLGTQEVTVVKSYRPNLKNVFKISSIPEIADSLIQKKQKVNYTFKSVPVISTFIPNKATPLKLKRQKVNRFHNSYISGGVGIQSEMLMNFSSMVSLDRYQSAGLSLRYNSLGGIPGTIMESSEKRLTLNILHQYKERNMRVDSDLRFDSQRHNFYGLKDIKWENIPSFRASVVNPLQRLNYLSLRSNWQWYDNALSKLNFNTHITTDYFDSTEYIIKINALFRIPMFGNYLELIPDFELINSNFTRDYYIDEPLAFKNSLTQLQTQFLNVGRRLNFRAGVNGFILSNSQSKFKLYPIVELTYKSSNGKIVPFFNYKGGYKLNSFTSLSLKNPYVAPRLDIQPTEVDKDINLGFDAYPSSGLSLKMVAIYCKFIDYPMFLRFPYDNFNNDISFRLGNSYGVIYDATEKKGMSTSISINLSEFNRISLITSYFDYKRHNDEPVWNTPSLTIDINGNFKLGQKLFFQFTGNYISSRDVADHIITSNELSEKSTLLQDKLGSIFSTSLSVTWKINSEWDLFYRNNIFYGNVTSRWTYYQNQTQLNLLGIRHKFDINL